MAKDLYIHGFSPGEQRRLVEQARILAHGVFGGLEIQERSRLLEVGCGVGAELLILRDRFPGLELVGVDRSASHLAAAKKLLEPAHGEKVLELLIADAAELPLEDSSFDYVITIWMLEHAEAPRAILKEALRVLKPGGKLILTEVDNATMKFEPINPLIASWWSRFNQFQAEAGGDPWIGRKLAGMIKEVGGQVLSEEERHIIDSRREPGRRTELLHYMRDLLLSGADSLCESGLADWGERGELEAAFQELEFSEGVEFQYYAVRVVAEPISG